MSDDPRDLPYARAALEAAAVQVLTLSSVDNPNEEQIADIVAGFYFKAGERAAMTGKFPS
jgi:hypothetical protein